MGKSRARRCHATAQGKFFILQNVSSLTIHNFGALNFFLGRNMSQSKVERLRTVKQDKKYCKFLIDF